MAVIRPQSGFGTKSALPRP